MGNFMNVLKYTFATLTFALSAFGLEGTETKTLDCYARGGGYIAQSLKVNRSDDGKFSFAMQRFTEVPEIVTGNIGLKLDDQYSRQVNIEFPAGLCRIKPTALSHVTLVGCSTGISKVTALLTRVDGSTASITLPDNFTIEVEQQDTNSVYLSPIESTVLVKMTGNEPINGLGFRIHECK